MSSWLLIIFLIGSSFGGFPNKFSKCCFNSLALAVLFLLLTSFTICHVILDCLSSTKSLILLIWFCMYSVCSFRCKLVSSFCALSFWAFILVGFLLLYREPIFTSAWFFLTAKVSNETLGLALCLVGVHSAATSKWALTEFSYSSFGVGVSDISWSALNLFLSINVYLSLISLLLSRDQS